MFAIVVKAATTPESDQSALIALACNTALRPTCEIVSPVVGARNVQVTSKPKTRKPKTTWARIANCKAQLFS